MDQQLMARLTRELGHSETTFLQPASSPGADGRVRIWIPTGSGATEVPFAGHPILGSACILAAGRSGPSTIVLETGVGRIAVAVEPLEDGMWAAAMEQPLPRLVWSRPGGQAAGEQGGVHHLAGALGLRAEEIRADLPVEAVDNGMQTVIIPLVSTEAVDRCRPDLPKLRELLGRDGLCTLVFAPGGREVGSDLYTRVFSPFDLVAEDPATGSANGPLAEYAVRHKVVTRNVIHSEQGDQLGRPSRIQTTVQTDADGRVSSIRVAGRVQFIGRGLFFG